MGVGLVCGVRPGITTRVLRGRSNQICSQVGGKLVERGISQSVTQVKQPYERPGPPRQKIVTIVRPFVSQAGQQVPRLLDQGVLLQNPGPPGQRPRPGRPTRYIALTVRAGGWPARRPTPGAAP